MHWLGTAKLLQAATITHNIATSTLNIGGSSSNNYIITGSTTSNRVIVAAGYHGTITLRNCTFNISDNGTNSPITICSNGGSNLQPNTVVNLVLEGNNYIYNNGGNRACIEVRQGAQLNIRAVNPNNDLSGTLCAQQANTNGGAAIGARINANEGTINGKITAGGNVTISSGIITAKGGHGAGIGGGFHNYYDGIIFIYGGIVDASSIFDAAGIGSGCPTGHGIINTYTPNSSIIVLPPAVITAFGAGASATGGVGYTLFPSLGLAGTNTIVYIGDVNKPAIAIHTDDYTPNADIYVDLSQNADVMSAYNAVIDTSQLDINQIHFGRTNANGIYTFHGLLQNPTTFFTDAASLGDASEGKPYLSTTVTSMTNGGTVVLNKLAAHISIQTDPSSPLLTGYTAQDADSSSQILRITYNDAIPLTNLQFSFANSNSVFPAIQCYHASDTTPCALPTSFQNGDDIIIRTPLAIDQSAALYNDVLRISGNYNGQPIGYIRKVVSQRVVQLSLFNMCDNDSVTFRGRTISQDGLYYDTINLSNESSSVSSYTSCNDITYTSLVTTTHKDSVVAAYVVLRQSSIDTLAAINACDTYTWQDITTTSLGSHILEKRYPSGAANGCDSVIYLPLTIYSSNAVDTVATACDNFSWWNTILTSSTNQATHRLTNAAGCDSIITLHLTVNHSTAYDTSATACDSFLWWDTLYTQSINNATYHLVNKAGCDSTITLHLSVKYSSSSDTTVTACNSFLWCDTVYTQSAYNAIHVLTNAVGCDSIVNLNLTVNYSDKAKLKINPDHLTLDRLGFTAYDISHHQVQQRTWYLDWQPQTDTGNTLYGSADRDADSIIVALELFNGLCYDTAVTTLPVHRVTLYPPNVFTPLQDNNNRFFIPNMGVTDADLYIYNREGLLICHTNDIEQGWDGRDTGGVLCPQGAYVWRLYYHAVGQPDRLQTLVGTVLLLR